MCSNAAVMHCRAGWRFIDQQETVDGSQLPAETGEGVRVPLRMWLHSIVLSLKISIFFLIRV